MKIGSMRKSNAKYYSDKLIQWSEKVKIVGFTLFPNKSKTVEFNFQNIIDKAKKILNTWTSRTLTLIGKVTVFNTLVVPLAVQKMTCLPQPPNWFFKNMDQLLRNFIWGTKKPKIALDTLKKAYVNGGLNLTDLRNKSIALRCTWVKKSLQVDNDHPPLWIKVANRILPDKINKIWECNISKSHIEKMYNGTMFTCVEIWKAWASFNYDSNIDENNVSHQKLWLNSKVLQNGLLYIDYKLREAGIEKLSCIIENNKIMTYSQLSKKFEIGQNSDFVLRYHRLVTNIPAVWRQHITNICNAEIYNSNVDLLIKNKSTKISKQIYIYTDNERFSRVRRS